MTGLAFLLSLVSAPIQYCDQSCIMWGCSCGEDGGAPDCNRSNPAVCCNGAECNGSTENCGKVTLNDCPNAGCNPALDNGKCLSAIDPCGEGTCGSPPFPETPGAGSVPSTACMTISTSACGAQQPD